MQNMRALDYRTAATLLCPGRFIRFCVTWTSRRGRGAKVLPSMCAAAPAQHRTARSLHPPPAHPLLHFRCRRTRPTSLCCGGPPAGAASPLPLATGRSSCRCLTHSRRPSDNSMLRLLLMIAFATCATRGAPIQNDIPDATITAPAVSGRWTRTG